MAFAKVGELYQDFMFFLIKDGEVLSMSEIALDKSFATNVVGGITFCQSSEVLRGQRGYNIEGSENQMEYFCQRNYIISLFDNSIDTVQLI